MCCLGSGEVLDCIDSRSLPSFLLQIANQFLFSTGTISFINIFSALLINYVANIPVLFKVIQY